MANEQLSDVLSEFARTMVTDFPIQGILDHLVKRIVEIMPISGAGVTLISPGSEPRFVAASNQDESGALCSQTTRNSLANPRSHAGENCALHGALK